VSARRLAAKVGISDESRCISYCPNNPVLALSSWPQIRSVHSANHSPEKAVREACTVLRGKGLRAECTSTVPAKSNTRPIHGAVPVVASLAMAPSVAVVVSGHLLSAALTSVCLVASEPEESLDGGDLWRWSPV
jgi:hypothetical protein